MQRRSSARWTDGWQTAAVLAVLLLLAIACFRRVWEGDFFWELGLGRDIPRTGIPYTDEYSYTARGGLWVEIRWLHCLVVYWATLLGGIPGAVVLKWLMIAGAFGFVTAVAVERRTVLTACAVLAVAILAASQRFFVRPELFTFLLFAIDLWLIERWRRGRGSPRAIWVVPLLQVVWANTHPLFFYGPVLVALWLTVAVGEALWARRPGGPSARPGWRQVGTALAILIVTTAACFVNAYGTVGALWPIQLHHQILSGAYNEFITEYWSPFAFPQHYTATLFFEVLIAMVLLSSAVNWRRLDPLLAPLCAAQLYLACIAIRNQALFSLAAVPLVLANVRDAPLWERPGLRRRLPMIRRAVAVAIVALCLGYSWDMATDRFNVRQGDTNQFGLGVARHRHPVEAVRFMEAHDVAGPVFSPFVGSSYLFYKGYEDFIDGRIEVFGTAQLERFVRLQQDARVWNAVAAQYGIEAALIDLDFALASFLRDDPGWKLVYFDESYALYARAGGPNGGIPALTEAEMAATAARLRTELPRPKPLSDVGLLERAFSPAPRFRLGKFLLLYGRRADAEPFLADTVYASPRHAEARSYLAALLLDRGDHAGAEREYEALLALEPEHQTAPLALGQLYLERGRTGEAIALLERATRRQPTSAGAWAVLGKAHAAARDYAAALAATERAVALEPQNAAYARNLATLRAALGAPGRARP